MARSINLDPTHRGGDLLTVALGTSVLMWAVAYVGLSPSVHAPPILIAAFALGCLLASGHYLARRTGRGISGGVKLGLLLGFINFLIVASFHGRESTTEALQFGAKWIVGFTIVAVALCTLGTALANRIKLTRPDFPQPTIDWTSRLAIVVAIALFPLLISGGIVTGLDAGLAVPDWLTTFDYPMMFYPLVAMQADGKVYAEHFHRLWGLLAGLSVILLAIQIHRADGRIWLRVLSIVIILAVIVQGIIGAAWVLDTQMRYLAVGHGIFGQIVFAAVVATAAFTSTTWINSNSRAAAARDSANADDSSNGLPAHGYLPSPIDRQASIALFLLLILQLGFGALYRHMRREAVDAMAGSHALWSHIFLAAILIAVIIFVAGRAWGVHRDKPVLPQLGKSMLHLLGLQIALGIGALIVALMRGTNPEPTHWEIAVTTSHQAVGAVMLAVAGLLVVWSRRLLA